MSASWESSRSSCCSGCWSAVASYLAPTRSGPAGQPASTLHLSLYSKQRNAGRSRIKNESPLFNRIHKQSFRGLGADTMTCCDLRVDSFFYPFLGFSVHSLVQKTSNYFHKELILFEKFAEIHPFSWIPYCTHGMSGLSLSRLTKRSTRYGDFQPNYFEYRLWSLGDNNGGKSVVSGVLVDSLYALIVRGRGEEQERNRIRGRCLKISLRIIYGTIVTF